MRLVVRKRRPFWTTHSGTSLALLRDKGRIIYHDTDFDAASFGVFNDHVLFANFTERMLAFNGRYDPFTMRVGMHTGPGREPFVKTPWTHRQQTKQAYTEDQLHALHDFMMFTPESLGEVNHGDTAVWHMYGNSPSDACGKFGYSSSWVAGVPAALTPDDFEWGVPCPYGLKVGKDEVFHGVRCPKDGVLFELTRYGEHWNQPRSKTEGGVDSKAETCRCRVHPVDPADPSSVSLPEGLPHVWWRARGLPSKFDALNYTELGFGPSQSDRFVISCHAPQDPGFVDKTGLQKNLDALVAAEQALLNAREHQPAPRSLRR